MSQLKTVSLDSDGTTLILEMWYGNNITIPQVGTNISSFNINNEGHLILNYKDNTSLDLGYILGQTGNKGLSGKSTIVQSFDLTDGTNKYIYKDTILKKGILVGLDQNESIVQVFGSIIGNQGPMGTSILNNVDSQVQLFQVSNNNSNWSINNIQIPVGHLVY